MKIMDEARDEIMVEAANLQDQSLSIHGVKDGAKKLEGHPL